jgi:hypothetical protein
VVDQIQNPNFLPDLETALRDLSHSSKALEVIRKFSASLKNTKERQKIFNFTGAIVRAPIFYEPIINKTVQPYPETSFELLQGDIVQTNSGYFLGERVENCKFIIATSTCDLMPQRREFTSLLRIVPLRKTDKNIKQLLGELLPFKSTQRMYLPPLEDDPEDIVANAIIFDGIVQTKLSELLLSRRCASLSLVGWRIFGAILRETLVRAGDDEVNLRTFFETTHSTS